MFSMTSEEGFFSQQIFWICRSRKSTGGANDTNDGRVPFKCPSVRSIRALELEHLHATLPWLMSLMTHMLFLLSRLPDTKTEHAISMNCRAIFIAAWRYCETAIWIVDCVRLETCYRRMSTSARGGTICPYCHYNSQTCPAKTGRQSEVPAAALPLDCYLDPSRHNAKWRYVDLDQFVADLWSAVFGWPQQIPAVWYHCWGRTDHLHSATLHSISLYLPCLLYRSPLQSQASPWRDTRWVTACNWNAGLTDAIFISSWKECLWGPLNKARHETGRHLISQLSAIKSRREDKERGRCLKQCLKAAKHVLILIHVLICYDTVTHSWL